MTTVHYQFSPSEATKSIVTVRRWNNRREVIWPAIFSALASLWGFARHVHHAKGHTTAVFLYGGVAAICAFLLTFFACRLYIRWFVARFVRRNLELFTSPIELSFDEERISFLSPAMTQRFAWSVFRGRRQSSTHFYFYSGTGGAFAIVPKRAFDEASLAEFRRCSQLPPSS